VSLTIIHLNGNLGGDAELRYLASGTPMLSFRVACASYLGSGERRQEHVDWYRCVLFGQRGEALASSLTKGTRVNVVGRLTHRDYTRQDGTPGCSLEVTVMALDFSSLRQASSRGAASELVVDADEVPF